MTQALAPDPFAPLSLAEADAVPTEVAHDEEKVAPVIPVPEDAPAAHFRHAELGEPSATWTYKDEAGRRLGHVARFETPSGKQILPRTCCRLSDGTHAWRWRAFAAPRPLYGLDRLAARPDAIVLVVEGEKTADAAQQHFPDYVAVTWPGGSNAAGKADWSVLARRRVVMWPDADGPGRKAAAEGAKLVTAAGAASVGEVAVPDGLPDGWDLADPVPEQLRIADLLASARPLATQ
jgi:putative DNA primase/helicase